MTWALKTGLTLYVPALANSMLAYNAQVETAAIPAQADSKPRGPAVVKPCTNVTCLIHVLESALLAIRIFSSQMVLIAAREENMPSVTKALVWDMTTNAALLSRVILALGLVGVPKMALACRREKNAAS